MRCGLLLLALLVVARGETARFELRGRLVPGTQASVWLHGATSPFEDNTLADGDGRFRFRNLSPGTYTLGVFVPGRGEVRQTVEVGPSLADSRGRIELAVELSESRMESQDSLRRGAMVSTRELAIPEQARQEYGEAIKRLAKREVDKAVAHLKRAVEIAPQFAVAWNHLGTIAYQTSDYPGAEACFRQALQANSSLFEPLVNLGGVLINLRKLDEALQYNRHAVLTRPNDALANSQLGMTFFELGRLDLGEKYLAAAKQIDPRHFSHPQLLLAEIDLRRGRPTEAAGELDEFLKYHPDWPGAPKLRDDITRLRARAQTPQAAVPAPGDPREFTATGMARSFSESPELPIMDDYHDQPSGRHYRVLRRDGRLYVKGTDANGKMEEARVGAVIGSGRHARALLSRSGDGHWAELPLTWFTEGEHWGASPGSSGPVHDFRRPVSADCLFCHTGQRGDHAAAIGCPACHASGKPSQAVCLQCHVQSSAPEPGHGGGLGGEEALNLNSAGYRLFQSRCHDGSGEPLGCASCHPAHRFSKTSADYRQVCRTCHPTMHESAALDCVKCHMPKRLGQDAGIRVTDHRIQRPL